MSASRALNLDLLLGRTKDAYSARVVGSPAGAEQLTSFPPPFTGREVEAFVHKMSAIRRRARELEAAPLMAAKQFGERLFNAVFAGPIGECLRRSCEHAEGEHAALRIRLHLSACPELTDLPWELLYDGDTDRFLALSSNTPVIRYVQTALQPAAVRVTLPLRILLVTAEPIDHPKLDLQAEWTQLASALEQLTDGAAIAVTQLAIPTLGELRRTLMRAEFHALHFLGHGGFSKQDGGVLLFTDEQGRAAPVTGERLGVILREHPSVRLVVLGACDTGRSDHVDPFAGVAANLLRRGIPAVLAMQFALGEQAASAFAPALYAALAAGRPVDVAVAEAREAIYTVSQIEWASPATYLQSDDARLFAIAAGTPHTVGASSSALASSSQVDDDAKLDAVAQTRWADDLCRQRRFAEAESAYRDAVELDPTLAEAQRGLAWALCGLERYSEAETAANAALALAPTDALSHLHLAVALYGQRQHAEAESACRDAIRLDTGDPRSHYLLSVLFAAVRRNHDAESACWEALRLSPYNAALQENLRLLVRQNAD